MTNQPQTQPIYYDVKMPDIAGNYIKGQQAASNIDYQQALMTQMKDSSVRDQQRIDMEQQKLADAKETEALNMFLEQQKPVYDAMLKNPNVKQEDIDLKLAKDKEFILQIAPNKGQWLQNYNLYKTPKGISSKIAIDVTKDNLTQVNGSLPKGVKAAGIGDRFWINTDEQGNVEYIEDAEHKTKMEALALQKRQLDQAKIDSDRDYEIKKRQLAISAQTANNKTTTKTDNANAQQEQVINGATFLDSLNTSMSSGKFTKEKAVAAKPKLLQDLKNKKISKEDYYKAVAKINKWVAEN